MLGLVAKIALEGAQLSYDKLYTYIVPPELHSAIEKGKRVLVPFGKGNTKKQGLVFSLETGELKGLKNLLSVIDDKPLLTEEMLLLCEYMKEGLFCTYYDVIRTMLPTGLGLKLVNYYSANEDFVPTLLSETEKEVYDYLYLKGEKEQGALIADLGITAELLEELVKKQALIKNCDAKQKVSDATQKWVKLCDEEIYAKLTQKQSAVIDLLKGVGSASVKEICYFTGVTSAVVEGLIKKEILIPFQKKVFRKPTNSLKTAVRDKVSLSSEQNEAFLGLMNKYNEQKGAVALLHGVTGSGKTQVYLKLAEQISADGRGVIVMVPEIALTAQLISIFTQKFGEKIAVFHSAMSLGQRMDEWQRIKEGKALIAVGTRSAVFAPFRDLGLIIIDEEQEHTYKSEKSPRFNARDIAKFRAAYHKGLLCLASATPSLESYTSALNGKYSLFTLMERYGNATLPQVETVDMNKEMQRGNKGVISITLYEAIKQTLQEKKQAIILLNRRGHNTYISCSACGYVEACPNCSVSLTYHSANDRLMCHYCGYSKSAEKACPQCQNEHMHFMGLGTQKAEEEIKLLFPNAKVLRLDADSITARDSHAVYLNDFANGDYDILLGTQMVAKGLDFPNVTLVGVLGADSAMYSEDFKSFERTFSLLTQVVGRAGRGNISGRAIIQTQGPDNDLIELAKNQDYKGFYNSEILNRKLMIYPPYCDICVVSVQSVFEQKAKSVIQEIFENIKQGANSSEPKIKVIILGPSPASVAKINNRYRFRMIIKCKNNKQFRKMLNEAIMVKTNADVNVSVDINPESVI